MGAKCPKRRSLIFVSCIAIPGLAFNACKSDQPDMLNAVVKVMYDDGLTPAANELLEKYELTFTYDSGSTFVKTFTEEVQIGESSTVEGLLTDENGEWSTAKSNINLNVLGAQTECYNVCTQWSAECYWDDVRGTHECYDYCRWYTTDCDSYYYHASKDFDDVVSASAKIVYSYNGSTVTTVGTNQVSRRDLSDTGLLNSWTQKDVFVTVLPTPETSYKRSLDAAAGPGNTDVVVTTTGSISFIGRDLSSKYKSFKDLNAAQLQALNLFRESMGLNPILQSTSEVGE